MEKKEFYLPWMKREEVKEAVENCVLLVPTATVEQHGPHLPFHTDTDDVTHMCIGVAETVNPHPRVLVSPTFWLVPSYFPPEVYPGGTFIRKNVFMDALNDILEGYLRGGFRKVVVVNGHGGGPEKWVMQVVERLNREKTSLMWPEWKIPESARVIAFSWFSFLGEFAQQELWEIRGDSWGHGGHACDVETSLQLHLHPELVDMQKAGRGIMRKRTAFGESDLLETNRSFIIEGYPSPMEEGLVDEVYGDPAGASAEKGRRLFDLAVRKIGEMVAELAEL